MLGRDDFKASHISVKRADDDGVVMMFSESWHAGGVISVATSGAVITSQSPAAAKQKLRLRDETFGAAAQPPGRLQCGGWVSASR